MSRRHENYEVSRSELFTLWSAFGRAKAFGSKVDVRLLLKDPSVRDETRYRKVLAELLDANKTGRTGPILLAREDALLKLLPRLERSEAGTFVAAAKLAEIDLEHQRIQKAGTVKVSNENHHAGGQTSSEIDPETLQELRMLFDLYDVDSSGFVDVQEIVTALKGNYSTAQISAGMGDAVTEGELAALLSSLTTVKAATAATATKGSGAMDARNGRSDGKKLKSGTSSPELDFHDFVRLFQGVF